MLRVHVGIFIEQQQQKALLASSFVFGFGSWRRSWKMHDLIIIKMVSPGSTQRDFVTIYLFCSLSTDVQPSSQV